MTIIKLILLFITICLIIFFIIGRRNPDTTKNNQYGLLHWNTMKIMHDLEGYIMDNPMTLDEMKNNEKIKEIVGKKIVPDSYAALMDQNFNFIVPPLFPQPPLKNLNDLPGQEVVKSYIKKSINENEFVRGFYTWVDKELKYIIVCPLNTKTKEGIKLFYSYTVYVRSMPEYYYKTLKNLN